MNPFKTLFSPLSVDEQVAARNVGHFYGIDLLRGLAAVAVVIWHYQFFFQAGPLKPTEAPADINRAIQPLYSVLWPAYEHGYWAVQLFWAISGFVFAHVYANRNTQLSTFALRRFARLYPLHLITLILVAVLQWMSWQLTGGFQIVSRNDPYHFVLHLFMGSQWGLQSGISFNAPVWSVSIEEPVYLLFFVTAAGIFKWGILRPVALSFVAFTAIHLAKSETPRLFESCIFLFFMGIGLYWITAKLRTKPIAIAAICAALSAFAIAGLTGHIRGKPEPDIYIQAAAFATVVLIAGSLDYRPWFGSRVKTVRWLGDATYSMYLWHFPVIVLGCTLICLYPPAALFLRSPIAIVLWIGSIILIGHLSFTKLERPLQRAVLGSPRLLARAKPQASLAPQSKSLPAADRR